MNPHVVSIYFGPTRAYMTFGVDQSLPKTGTKLPAQTVVPKFIKPNAGQAKFLPNGIAANGTGNPVARFAAIQTAVESAIGGNYGFEQVAPVNPRLRK